MTDKTPRPGIRPRLRPFSLLTASMALACAATGARAAPDAVTSPPRASDTAGTPDRKSPAPPAQDQYNHASDSRYDQTRVTASPMNVLHESIGLSRMPQDAMHTPQNVNVVPQILMQQQNVKSLDEALKNVPGITASVGEGEGGMAGDQFLIRGFAAQNDIYENGLRDFGVYTRDSFYYDHVSVIKGPSSEVFGNGTTGGAINIVTKTPHLGNSYQASFSGGSGSYYRGTLDVNYQIGSSTAFRLTGMGNENNVVGRDYIYSHRWGIAPSIAFGLGKKVSFVLEYFHQNDNRIPDYGVPVVYSSASAIGRPVTEYGVRRTNWYGTTYDQDDSSTDMITGRLTARVSPILTLYNDMRGGIFHRYFSASQEACSNFSSGATLTNNTINGVAASSTCQSDFFSSNPGSAVVARNGGVGGPEPYRQSDWSIQDVFSGVAHLKTGHIRHEIIGGFDIEYVTDHRQNYAYGSNRPGTSLLDPSPYVPGLTLGDCAQYPNRLVNIGNGVGRKCYKDSDALDVGFFLSDQVWLTDYLSVKAGFRWDNWNSHYSATGGSTATPDVHYGQNETTINPSVSIMYTPRSNLMVYFNWSESTTPLSLYVTNSSEPMTRSSQTAAPERSRLYEVGAKYSAFHDRIGFTAALFRLEKNNAVQTDPSTGDVSATSDQERNQGLELSVSGTLMRNWMFYGTYALYDPTITKAGSTTSKQGGQIQYVPHNQATAWTSYEIAPRKPWNMTVGGGITWRQGVWLDQANTARVPATVEFDAMVSHHFDNHWKVAMNAYNLDNRLNYGSLFSNRVTPSIGRSFLFNISAQY
ncbi:TonB-dependent siderophore receptor [Komagataeibacter rhaeticus]|uniref:TonB-dependent receptor n=1 Tax=Komagataeibacter rhaeticus TaxID=215221 RepID=A0A181C9M5_9PROT|nr:TonB-dependent receptor [Komagataeibacter rhaeticus]KDU96745.1 membrane protein [Komagataeibacter rhaeticus AF1]MBL7241058.1 TonB-dependent receptor [Komagataeibacter rhaeticus]PYD54369.1 TonB-dependent siderophore receptor [Komagataeibacter rhaeticus]QIP35107.1 TonB-dependent receptor [Komagataeibacter rhaeticus]QOC47662.1 TonB-dependent receptor [Komagataeibacter rhaeticus]